ncbi:Transcriptional regulator, Crp/Fnr family [hydrothermal vent metagenome]|uniref:Transcriptional regulator, Crp/Fnr family n=1 Tax=hydrothermal vent metagenome TaxID=652676 RepID=A0A3B0W5F8_9ZZZZ
MNINDDRNTMLWSKHFPQLMQTDDPAITRMIEKSRYLEIPTNFQISTPGVECNDYLLVIGGSVRVQIVTEKGREVVLYHVCEGESCILTTSCLLSGATFPAESYTEKPTEALALPAAEFDLAIAASTPFRNFVFTNFAHRLASVISRVEQLCSPSIDRDLASALLRLSKKGSQSIVATHQELASELGTAREVVSRHLKRFEDQGWVSLGRGTIQINSPDLLSSLNQT